MAKRRQPNLAKLSPTEQWTYRLVLDAKSLMARHPRKSLAQAARESGTSPATVLRYAGAAFYKRHGRYRAKDVDRLRRELTLYDKFGKFKVVTHSSKAASLISRYHGAIKSFIYYGDPSALEEFKDRRSRLAGIVLRF